MPELKEEHDPELLLLYNMNGIWVLTKTRREESRKTKKYNHHIFTTSVFSVRHVGGALPSQSARTCARPAKTCRESAHQAPAATTPRGCLTIEVDKRRLVRVVVLALELLRAEDEGLFLLVLVGVVCCCVSCGLFDVRHCWLAREGIGAQGEGLVLHAQGLKGDLGVELAVGCGE